MADETKLTVGACMAAAAVMSAHGHPDTRGRLSALLVAEAERLADLGLAPMDTPDPARPLASAFQDLEER